MCYAAVVAQQLAGQQYRTTRVLQLQVTTTGALSQALAKTWKTTNSIVVVLGPQSSPSWAPPALLVDKALELGPGQSLVLTTPAALLSAQTAKAKPGSAGAAIARSALLQVNCEASDTGGFLSARWVVLQAQQVQQ
jgi:hypothetical protein